MTAAIHQIRLVGNLANRKNYEYTAVEATKIVRELQREVDELKSKFKGEHRSARVIFRI